MDSPALDPLARQRRTARGLAVRDALLSAAQQTIASQGYGAAGVAEIAIAAGLSKNHVFQHFGSKEALGLAALERSMLVWRAEVAGAARIFPQAERQLAHAAQALAGLAGAEWAGLACIAALATCRVGLPPELATAVDLALDELAGFFREVFKEARKSGKLRSETKPRLLAQVTLAALLGGPAAGSPPSDALSLLATALLPG